MKGRELRNLGIPAGDTVRLARDVGGTARGAGLGVASIRERIRKLVAAPESFRDDAVFGKLAARLLARREAQASYVPREKDAPYRQWGEDLEPESVRQLENACKLPVAVRGALMPDAHRGYGLPIGGVLATRNSVIPYAV